MPGILIVEDDRLHLDLIVDALTPLNQPIHTANRAREGIELARQVNPSVIFMDIALPEMDGLTAIRLIRADVVLADIPIVAVTATRTSELVYQLREAGVDGYITKPFQLQELRDYAIRFASES
jgi:two-component system cell cycle response regulator DivK